jgi:type IV pilus assembly protein PilN
MTTTDISALLTPPPPPPDNRLWSSMPGWGIVADLTPPELIAERHLRVLRKYIVVGLALVVVLCGSGYALAVQKHSTAADARNAITARTEQLQQQLENKSFSNVVRIQGTLAQVQVQVAALLKNDVDLPALLGKVRAALPASMAINTMSVTLTPAGTAAAGGAAPTLDTSGHLVIGTVVVGGSSKTLDDLPTYVDRLAKVKGISNLVPTSNGSDTDGVKFSLAFAITDRLYSHRYDVATTGSK